MGQPPSTVAVLTFLSVWNDFLWPLVVTSSPQTMTVELGSATFQSAHFTNRPVLMAGTVLSQHPVLALFLLGQRYFVSSIATTGIKRSVDASSSGQLSADLVESHSQRQPGRRLAFSRRPWSSSAIVNLGSAGSEALHTTSREGRITGHTQAPSSGQMFCCRYRLCHR